MNIFEVIKYACSLVALCAFFMWIESAIMIFVYSKRKDNVRRKKKIAHFFIAWICAAIGMAGSIAAAVKQYEPKEKAENVEYYSEYTVRITRCD